MTAGPASRADATRGRLIEAAIAAFAEHGYHGTTTRDIASAAGMSPAALYVHHASKEELLYLISHAGHEQMLALLSRAVDSSTDPVEQLRAVMHDFTLFHVATHDSARIVNYELAALAPPHLAEIEGFRSQIVAGVRGPGRPGQRGRRVPGRAPPAGGGRPAVAGHRCRAVVPGRRLGAGADRRRLHRSWRCASSARRRDRHSGPVIERRARTTVVLTDRTDIHGTTRRAVQLVDHGGIAIVGQDLGVEGAGPLGFPDYEFERRLSSAEVAALRPLLGLSGHGDLLTAVAERFGTTRALEAFLDQHGISGTFWSRIGD